MQSVPEPKDKKKATKPDERTRAQRIVDKGGSPLYPPLDEEAYLLDYLARAGIVRSTGYGPQSLSASDFRAWADAIELPLAPWEIETLALLSAAYVDQHFKSKAEDCEPPFGNPEIVFDREVIERKIRVGIRALMADVNKRT